MARVLTVKIQSDKGHKANLQYKNTVNLEDYKQLAIILSDLELYGAKLEKAITEFRKQKKGFPW